MAITKPILRALLQEARRRPFEGSAIQLGRQSAYFDDAILASYAQQERVALSDVGPPTPSWDGKLADCRGVDDVYLFRRLGFAEVHSLDASSFEGATHVVDLNNADLPEILKERYEFVFNGGTLEHVFDVPTALRNVFAMLRENGRVMHLSPASNFVDHGFWMLSPTLFADYYASNGWSVETLRILHTTPESQNDWCDVYEYTPEIGQSLSGRLPSGVWAVLCVATKTSTARCDRIPNQGYYVQTWKHSQSPTVSQSPAASQGPAAATPASQGIGDSIPVIGKALTPARWAWRKILRRVRRHDSAQLRRVARY